ncbi:ArnT family glycosyltransferase [Alloscardovia omnicolens]|uniref:ArnT family glycosyltransferase n=1 Tax=Alloscardovia omnicolens TaxID=419015 RepID=UPI00254E7312|nr:glycosyltransferase family 39 protein [Alloscardovia omnicolens]MDK6644041.1 glycosyltransferase family 39 protein [Alloscardovia omnicolens]
MTSSTHSRSTNRYTNRFVLPSRSRTDWIAFGTVMLAAVAVFFVNLTASGYANEFYSAAAQAGSQNWWAFLWGSSDAGNAITVDKPPASIWLMALSVRAFGLNSFAILLPQAVLGVLTTGLIYSVTRRYWGNWTGILASVIFMTTPVAALMFRFNNPDALLVFLEVAAVAATLRALEHDTTRLGNLRRTGWMALAGVAVGFGFLTKQLQVMLILPGIALAFMIASPTKFWRRLLDGIVTLVTMTISAGWWVLLTVLVPASMRPYIGGSQNNSFLELTFGYNGLGRLTGDETGSVVPGESGKSQGGQWGETGWNRLFTSDFNGQISWLVFAALAGLIVALAVAGWKNRTDIRRACAIIFGGWLIVTWLIFSYMSGIFHAYYTVAIAPAIAVLSAAGVALLWSERHTIWAPLTAAVTIMITAGWSFTLISQASGYAMIAYTVLITGGIAGIIFIALGISNISELNLNLPLLRTISALGAALALVSALAGPIAWTAATISTGHRGSIVSAGPQTSMGGGPRGGGMAPPSTNN